MENTVIDTWQLEAWITRLGSVPVNRIAHVDYCEPYEMRQAHVFKLENGQYALVTEVGCSCYSSSDAQIDLFPTQKAAKEAFDEWSKEHRRGA